MSDAATEPPKPPPRAVKILVAALIMLMGLGAGVYLHWPALTDPLVYKSDVRQSPHWAAYHTDSFQDDDLLLTLATHNESPLQNLIYYVGTFAVDMVTLGKWLAVLSYGLTAALFFWLGQSLYGLRVGVLAAICFTFFPDQFEYSAGGFSKAWMIPVILCCWYILERRKLRWLLLLMPFGAVAYPVSTVMTGAIVLTYVLLEFVRNGWRAAQPVFWMLCAASALALATLFGKYIVPPEGIGSLTSSHVLREMPEMYRGGMWHYLPLPTLTKELVRRLGHPFVIFSAVTFFVCLGAKGLRWSTPMTAIALASMAFYLIARESFMHLYQPNRYTRYSLAILLAFWHARNWDAVLGRVRWRSAQAVILVAVLALGGFLCKGSFRMGKDTGDRKNRAALNRFIATLPDKILVAGHPMYMDDIPVQAHRSVLCNYKLAHPWYSEYYPEVRRRTEATFDALYTGHAAVVNRLATEWGVTHLVVVKRYLTRRRIADMDIYVRPYNDYIANIAHRTQTFLLAKPPPESVVYEDWELYVVKLPIPDKRAAAYLDAEPGAQPPLSSQ